MAGGIPLDWLINITSTGIRDKFSLSKLPSIVITKADINNPKPKFNRYLMANEVINDYGISAKISQFASNYFIFTSKVATQADLLNIYTWNTQDTQAILQGAKLSYTLDDLKRISGTFALKMGDNSFDFAVDSFASANSLSDIANILQTSISAAFENAEVVFNAIIGGFVVKSGDKGDSASIGYFEKASNGNDISGYFGLRQDDGALKWSGYNGINDISGVLSDIELENGAYYNITTDFELENEIKDLQTIGKFTAQSKGRFLFTYISKNKALINQRDFTANLKGYNGLNLEYRVSDNQDGYSSGIISAINFSRTNGNYNVAFNSGQPFDDVAITKEQELETLESNLTNSYLKFGKLGQFQTWYGLGNIMGELTNSLNVYIANSYLIFSEQFALANMFNSQPMIGLRGTNNQGLIRSYLENVFNEAVNSAIIIQGAKLTTTEKNAILTAFGDSGQIAIKRLEHEGFYYFVDSVDLVNKTINITQAYVANTPIKRVIIANYVLGA